MGYKKLVFVLSIIVCQTALSQNSIFQNHSYRPFDRFVYKSNTRFHTSIKPFNTKEVSEFVSLDTLFTKPLKNNALSYLFNNRIVEQTYDNLHFTIQPIVNFETSKQYLDTVNGWINCRGISVEADINEKVYLATSFYEIQSNFKDYRKDRIKELGNNTVPGQSRGKVFGKNKDGLDYAFADAYIGYSPNKTFDFQFGHGKHFIGDGYRSLLLSDNAMNYPYFRIVTNVWNIKYVNMWSQQYFNPIGGNYRFEKKWNVMHYLNWAVTDWLQIGFFETIIWQNSDTISGTRGLEFNYLNPVIFLRPVEFSIGSPDNVLMGLSGKLTLWKNHVFYGQVIIDEFNMTEFKKKSHWWGSKYAMQVGYKTFDIAGIKNLDVQSEINYVRPFMYSHFNEGQNYGHALQSLAHPRGSNFYESVSFLRYSYKRFFFEAKFLYLVHGSDTSDASFGNNIFKLYTTRTEEYGHTIAESNVKNTVVYKDLKVSYLINPHNNMSLSFGITNRTQKSDLVNKNQRMYYFAFSTNLQNFYYDF